MVIWTLRARADLKAIHDYIAKDSRQNAKRVAHEIRRCPTGKSPAAPHQALAVTPSVELPRFVDTSTLDIVPVRTANLGSSGGSQSPITASFRELLPMGARGRVARSVGCPENLYCL